MGELLLKKAGFVPANESIVIKPSLRCLVKYFLKYGEKSYRQIIGKFEVVAYFVGANIVFLFYDNNILAGMLNIPIIELRTKLITVFETAYIF